MPRLKQPVSLQNMAMDVLVGFLTNCCDQVTSETESGDLWKLRELVATIKSEICVHIPWNLASGFYKLFFQEFENLQELRINRRPDIHQRIILEIIMDREIIGLRCEGPIMACLDPSDAHRLRGLRLLNLSFHCYALPLNLEKFNLKDLTTLVLNENCTDADLEVIGKNCRKLEFLDVTDSEGVTNRGLRFLNSCSELRFVLIAFCRVSHTGITQLLSDNKKIENLSAWANSGEYGFDCFSHNDSSVYPLINKFTIVLDRISNEHLRSVAVKFPNLNSLGISGYLAADFCVFKYFDKLSRLDFSHASGFSWDNLKTVLTSIGENIINLKTCCTSRSSSCVTQSDLNHLFQYCKNIENLEIDYRPRFESEKLAIPPFEKLKKLRCRIPNEYRRRKAGLEFKKLSELEELTIDRFHISASNIESVTLDNDKFPQLKIIIISQISGRYDGIDHISQFAKNHNLDLEIVGI